MNGSWALILGASSGFGAALSLELAQAGMNILGVHLDHSSTRPAASLVRDQIHSLGRQAIFFNANAADAETRSEVIARAKAEHATIRVMLHSLAFGSLRPLIGSQHAVTKRQLEMTVDVMGHSLVYWAQDLVSSGLMGSGGRIFALTSQGASYAVPQYGAVCAAKAALEAHVRQLSMELAPHAITVNAIRAGVALTPALQKIPNSKRLVELAMIRNPMGRLTTPCDVAKCIVALCHENTYWMTGNTIRVDGGESSAG
jgi:NAD(P)-dependent dehydrogenase (short-subunit alcohol dehydrogenase family)